MASSSLFVFFNIHTDGYKWDLLDCIGSSCTQRKLAFEMTQEQSFSFSLRPKKNQPCVFLVVGAEESWGTPQTIYRKQSLLEKSTPNIFCEVNHFRIWTLCWFIHGVIWSDLFSVKEISRTKDTESSPDFGLLKFGFVFIRINSTKLRNFWSIYNYESLSFFTPDLTITCLLI